MASTTQDDIQQSGDGNSIAHQHLVHTSDQYETESQRQTLLAQLEVVRQQIQSQISFLIATQKETEHAESIQHLNLELAHYEGLIGQVTHAHLSQLPSLSHAVSHQVTQTNQTIATISGKALHQASHLLMEMSHEKIHAMQNQHDQETLAFRAYEQHSHQWIEQLAKQNGIDLSAYNANRQKILEHQKQAQQNGDRVDVFKQDALLAINNYHGIGKAGGSPKEIEDARQKAEEAMNRAIREVQIEAMRQGRQKGLSGKALQEHITNETQSFIDQELRPKQEGLRRSNEPPTELKAIELTTRIMHRAKSEKQFENREGLNHVDAIKVNNLEGNRLMAQRSTVIAYQSANRAEMGAFPSQKGLPKTTSQTNRQSPNALDF